MQVLQTQVMVDHQEQQEQDQLAVQQQDEPDQRRSQHSGVLEALGRNLENPFNR